MAYVTIGPYKAGGVEIPEQWVHAWDDALGADIDLDGYTVDVQYRVRHAGVWGDQVILDDEASLFDAATGRTIVTWSAADFALDGIMAGEIIVTAPGGVPRMAETFQCVILPPRGGTFPA